MQVMVLRESPVGLACDFLDKIENLTQDLVEGRDGFVAWRRRAQRTTLPMGEREVPPMPPTGRRGPRRPGYSRLAAGHTVPPARYRGPRAHARKEGGRLKRCGWPQETWVVPAGLSVGAGLDESRGAARAFAAVVAPETASMAAPIFFWPKVAPTGSYNSPTFPGRARPGDCTISVRQSGRTSVAATNCPIEPSDLAGSRPSYHPYSARQFLLIPTRCSGSAQRKPRRPVQRVDGHHVGDRIVTSSERLL